MSASTIFQLPVAASEPAGGAAIDQVIIATTGAALATALLLWLVLRHRARENSPLGRMAAVSERVSGLPGWAALPSGVAAVSLLIALLGMYWDISLHIDQGRDPGPLANPAHYLILVGLFGVFSAGILAIALPAREKPGPAAVRLGSYQAPVGGILIASAGAFALIGFPLDDMWHRLFGQDVTLWGPTHLMLIGGAGMTLIGQAVLLAEGMRARRESGSTARGIDESLISLRAVTSARRVGLMGGLLIGLSTFQAEFDFGVPQFRLVFAPLLVALAAGTALAAARIWIGPGGAIGAALFFLVVRGIISLAVGPILGETTPAMPLYLGSAVLVEGVAVLVAARARPLAFGAASGLVVGTAGFWIEWAWSQAVMPLPWTSDVLPEGLILSTIAGVAGGLIGALIGSALRGELPRPTAARTAFAASVVAVGACVGYGLMTSAPSGTRATVDLADTRPAPHREVRATVRIQPASVADGAAWVQVTAWQGGGLVVDRLKRTGPGEYRSTKPIPVYGDWKALLRLHGGNTLAAVPIYLPRDSAIPAPEVPARAHFTRPFEREVKYLQRERKQDVPGWLFAAASFVVLAIALAFLGALAWGLARVARTGRPPTGRRPEAAAPPSRATPVGA
ncbi:MAG: hypothetical protein QOE65_530 [Solirubrobacteraceae bacterium]|jgi:hypothetical protein|nr:hypothetical protein [Solirubrobacteraceae bacterium]